MSAQPARLYTLCISHPGLAVAGMLAHKGIEHEVVELWPATHPAALKVRGFSDATVPALKLGSERWQNSLVISRALEELQPDPPLFPADPDQRREVIRAEAWGESFLQDVPRRIFRYLCVSEIAVRRWLAETAGIPAPRVVAHQKLLARIYARSSGADETQVRADLAVLPLHLDFVCGLLDDGVIGGTQPNAADFQIASSLISLAGIGDLAPYLDAHRATRWARTVLDDLPGPCPAGLPAHWLAPLDGLPRGAAEPRGT